MDPSFLYFAWKVCTFPDFSWPVLICLEIKLNQPTPTWFELGNSRGCLILNVRLTLNLLQPGGNIFDPEIVVNVANNCTIHYNIFSQYKCPRSKIYIATKKIGIFMIRILRTDNYHCGDDKHMWTIVYHTPFVLQLYYKQMIHFWHMWKLLPKYSLYLVPIKPQKNPQFI